MRGVGPAPLWKGQEQLEQGWRVVLFSGTKSRLQTPLVLGALLRPALVFLGTGRDRPADGVLNPSAAISPSDWKASSDRSETTVSRVGISDGPQGSSTAVEVRREGDGGKWALALAGLRNPVAFFQRGHTYRMQIYARDLSASGQSVGLLLANSNFAHRPTEATRYARYSDSDWHLLQRTFAVTASAAPDTALYLSLPVKGPLRWQFTQASVREVEVPRPAEVTGGSGDRLRGAGRHGPGFLGVELRPRWTRLGRRRTPDLHRRNRECSVGRAG
jgi:hypothetical protein